MRGRSHGVGVPTLRSMTMAMMPMRGHALGAVMVWLG